MKTLKLGLLSLLAILAVSVFLTSCEQENISLIPNEEINNEALISYQIPIPEGMTISEIQEWIQTLDEEEIMKIGHPVTSDIENIDLRGCYWDHFYYSTWDCGCSPKARKVDWVSSIEYCNGEIDVIVTQVLRRRCKQFTC